MNAILSLSLPSDRRAAARATAGGAALFYGFGNFCALAGLPDRASVLRISRMKGRHDSQPGSVTSDPARMQLAFDWSRLPRELDAETMLALMTELQALGPIGFRGPASRRVPDHLAVMDGDVRTVQHISPGVRCRSNALVREILDLTGDDLLFVTSANRSGNLTKQAEAAHCEMDEIRRAFGDRRNAVMIGHDDEATNRAFYPRHLPCSTSIVSFHRRLHEAGRPSLVLERHGSLAPDEIRNVAARHGLGLAIAPSGRERVPVRWPREQQAAA